MDYFGRPSLPPRCPRGSPRRASPAARRASPDRPPATAPRTAAEFRPRPRAGRRRRAHLEFPALSIVSGDASPVSSRRTSTSSWKAAIAALSSPRDCAASPSTLRPSWNCGCLLPSTLAPAAARRRARQRVARALRPLQRAGMVDQDEDRVRVPRPEQADARLHHLVLERERRRIDRRVARTAWRGSIPRATSSDARRRARAREPRPPIASATLPAPCRCWSAWWRGDCRAEEGQRMLAADAARLHRDDAVPALSATG